MPHTALRTLSAALVLGVLIPITACVSVQKTGEESAPPAPSRATAIVSLDSRPGAAELYINGDFRGTTPVNLELEAGSHEIEFRLEGFEPWKRTLVVVAGDSTRVMATLRPE